MLDDVYTVDFERVPVVAALGFRNGDRTSVDRGVFGRRGDVEPSVCNLVFRVEIPVGVAPADAARDELPGGASISVVSADADAGTELCRIAVRRYRIDARGDLALRALGNEQLDPDDVALDEFALALAVPASA